MVSAAAILLLALVAQAREDLDVLVLKDGRKLMGVIVREDDQRVMLKITAGGVAGNVAVRRDEIAEIRRGAASGAAQPDAGVAPRITVAAASVLGRPGFVASGELVEVRSTGDGEFAREVCDALERAYARYVARFKPRRQPAGRQVVILLSGRAEYDDYMKRSYGASAPDPAVYRTKEGVLVACDCIDREEGARMRDVLRERRKEIDDIRRKAAEREKRNRDMVRDARQEVIDQANEEKARLRREGKATPEALREVDRKKEAALALAEQLGRAYVGQDDEGKKEAKAIKDREEAIRHDETILASHNRGMFRALFHESFHAFARSRLDLPRWLDEGMACCFESSVVEAGGLRDGPPSPDLLKTYRDAAKTGSLPRIEFVLRGTDVLVEHEGRIDRAAPARAAAWALASHVRTRMTPDQLDGYAASVAAGTDPADALAKALGEPLSKIDEAVRAHVKAMH